MRKYSLTQKNKIIKMKCNFCGYEMKTDKGIVVEGVCSVDCSWGYFSGKDGETHSFDICEKCYDNMVKQFKIPADIKENRELL